MRENQNPDYILGHSDEELARLGRQAAYFRDISEEFLRRAGIQTGMRVLDFGSGAGDYAFLVAELVGPEGAVLGIERSPEALATARRRGDALGLRRVEFRLGDETVADGSFDAVVGRFVLMYQKYPAGTIRRLASTLVPGGIVAFQEPNVSSRGWCHPSFPLFHEVLNWIATTLERGGVDGMIGLDLHRIFEEAGLPSPEVRLTGIVSSSVERAPFEYLASTLRTLLPMTEKLGIAARAEIGIDTLAERLHREAREARASVVAVLVAGACSRR